jgi:hypothetical protein
MLVMVLPAATIFHDHAGRVTGKARTDSNGVTTYHDAAGKVLRKSRPEGK